MSIRGAARKPTIEQSIQREFRGREVPLHEIHGPTGGGPSKGTILSIHGGGWIGVGADWLRSMDAETKRWNDRGWTTVNVDYHALAESERDVLDFFDAIKQSRVSSKPMGTIGASAGGHLSLMVAARRPALDFAISEAGPTDLATLNDLVRPWAVAGWGEEGLAAHSPLALKDAITAPVLLGHATADMVVPVDQARRFKQARPDDTRYVEMGEGSIPFVHSSVDAKSFGRFVDAERDIAKRATRENRAEQRTSRR